MSLHLFITYSVSKFQPSTNSSMPFCDHPPKPLLATMHLNQRRSLRPFSSSMYHPLDSTILWTTGTYATYSTWTGIQVVLGRVTYFRGCIHEICSPPVADARQQLVQSVRPSFIVQTLTTLYVLGCIRFARSQVSNNDSYIYYVERGFSSSDCRTFCFVLAQRGA